MNNIQIRIADDELEFIKHKAEQEEIPSFWFMKYTILKEFGGSIEKINSLWKLFLKKYKELPLGSEFSVTSLLGVEALKLTQSERVVIGRIVNSACEESIIKVVKFKKQGTKYRKVGI